MKCFYNNNNNNNNTNNNNNNNSNNNKEAAWLRGQSMDKQSRRSQVRILIW